VCLELAWPPAVKRAAQAVGCFAPAARPFRAPTLCLAPAWRVRPPEVSGRWAQVRPRVAEHAAPPLAAELPGAEEEPAAPRDAVAAPVASKGAVAAVAVGAEPAEGVALAASQAVSAGFPSGLPWVAASVSRQGPIPPWPAPARSAPTARVMALPPDAWPRKLSWRAALIVGSSCALGSEEFEKGRREWAGDYMSPQANQQTSVRPDCGGPETGMRISFV
jgi:hypothetical protein